MRIARLALWLTLLLPLHPAVVAGQALDAAAQRRIDSLENVLRTKPLDTQAVHNLNELGWRYLQNDPARARRYIQRALARSRELRFVKGEDKALTLLGIHHSIAGRYDSANQVYEQSLRLRQRRHDKSGIAAVYNNLAMNYLYQGDYPRGTRTMIKALKLEEELGDSVRIQESLSNLGLVYIELKDYDEAERIFRRYLVLATDSAHRAAGLSNLAIVRQHRGFLPEAQQLAVQAARLAHRAGDRYTELSALINLGGIENISNDDAAAARTYRQALVIADELPDPTSQAKAAVGLGQSLFSLNPRDPQVETLLFRGLRTAREAGVQEPMQNAFEALSQLEEHRGHYALALRYARRSAGLRDSLLDEASARQINELRARYETAQKEQRNRVQALELVRKDLILHRRNLQLLAALLGVVAVGFIGWLLLSRARLRQRLALEAEKQRQQRERAAAVMEAEERERRRIGADLHDGVGQLLSAAKLNLSGLEHELQLRDPAQEALLTNALDTLDESLREVRSLSHQLVPNALLRRGLVAAVREFLDKLAPGALRVELEVVGLTDRLPAAVENVVYRAIQEVVANIVRHSHADQVSIQLLEQPGELSVIIEDNGVGFDVAAAQTKPDAGIGLRNLFSRIDYLGGHLEIDSRPGRGTIVSMEVPTAPAPAR